MSKKILIAGVVVILVALIIGLVLLVPKTFSHVTSVEKAEITNLVEGFGKTLSKVDMVALSDIVSQNIKELYSPFLTNNLLSKWTFEPSKALGRVCSSPWPDRIEITSMNKLDKFTVKVKGYVVWVTSGGNGTLEVSEKVPVVLIVKKDPSTQKFKIDNAYSNEFAFYDGKTLLNTLNDAFSDIGVRNEPYVQRVMYLTGGTSPEPVAIVDMGTGGAYTEYYTLCKSLNGHLELVNFKDKDGKIAPLFFCDGASIKHEARLQFKADSSSNLVVYQSVIDKDDAGKVTNIEVDAYVWNDKTKMFEYSNELSESIKKDLQKKLASEVISLSSLKYKEIKNEFPAIRAVAVYEDEIAFSCGTQKKCY
ncbi:hypothetical protein [Caldisericum sp. AR60]|uniref:hypothetical protein n=1 Tax=Caldisericum sp. AR60 TaxID=3397852 RepID=UPI0039FD8BE0